MSSDRPVLHVVPSAPWGGIQALVPMLAREQMRQGKAVQLLCLGSGTRIRALAADYGLAGVTRSVAGRLAPLHLLRALRGARGAIVHSHCEPVWAAAMIALAARGRWIEHAHVYPERAPTWKARIALGLRRRFATRHIAISQSIGRALIASGVAVPDTLDMVHNGVLVEAIAPTRSPAPQTFTLGFVGRVVEEKGIFDFIELAALMADAPGLAFAVYGDGADLAAARALAAARTVADRITFHGYVEDIATAWDRIDAAAVFSHREPFGLVFLEAALHGVPTISYDSDSGGSEVAATLASAQRVAPGDLAAAAAIVGALAADRAAPRAALAQDRVTIAEHFAITAMAQGVEAAYRNLDQVDVPGAARGVKV